METKICGKCKEQKTRDMFSKNKNHKDGLENYCKECTKKRTQEYYIKNREKILQKDKMWQIKNKENIKKYQKEYREKNKERLDKYMKETKEQRTKRNKQYYKLNKEKILEKHKKYVQENKDHINEYQKNYRSQRFLNDEIWRFKTRVRSLISSSFKRKGFVKSKKTFNIIGMGQEEFREYLNKTFFENYGYEYNGEEAVHIDHIIPLAIAKTEEDVIKLCHYTNLQLLKATDNLRKSAKM
jgi:hypothetical protein